MIDECCRDSAELHVEVVEERGEQIPFQFVFDGTSHKPAQAAIADMGLDPCGEFLFHAHGPLRYRHALIIPR